MSQLNITGIMKILPQRYPFLFIDKVIKINKKKSKVVCQKNMTINEQFFQGHFPNNPIVPGAIIIEAMAQASIILYAVLKPNLAKRSPNYFLGKVEASFKKPVIAGDILILEATKDKILDTGGIVKTMAKVNNTIVATATITFGVKLLHP